MNWEKPFATKLASSSSYREFLSHFFRRERVSGEPRALSYQEFASRAGFASKSFLNEVIAGRKRLTPASVEKVAAGLSLDERWKEYFVSLVASEEDSFHVKGRNADSFKRRASLLRAKLLSTKSTRRSKSRDFISIFLRDGVPETFAALGSLEKGASFAEIERRCQMPTAKVESVLKFMVENGLASLDSESERYFAVAEAIDVGVQSCPEFFRADYFRALKQAQSRFDRQVGSTGSFFTVQTFSVSEKDLPELKTKLRQLIEEFSDNAENPEGDLITELCLSFTNNSTKS